MTPANCLRYVIRPAIGLLGAARFSSPEAESLLLATALQESGLRHREQVGGPAHGLWQFELGGGCQGVLKHPASRTSTQALCAELMVRAEAAAIYASITDNDLLAAALARLLYWTDAAPLPQFGDTDGNWSYYLRTWRPGKPHWARFLSNYAQATAVVRRFP